MTTFAPKQGRFSGGNNLESFAAHVLGDIGSSYNFSILPNEALAGTPWASNPASFWNGTDHWEYHFLDSAPALGSSGTNSLSIYTDHFVRSTGTCETPPIQANISSNLAIIQVLTTNKTVYFPALALGTESIYFLTAPVLLQNDGNVTCGAGCQNVKVLEPAAGPDGSPGGGTSSPWFYYDCNITVSSATNDLSPQNAAIAAQSTALSGLVHSEFEATGEATNEYVAYSFGLPFGEPQNKSSTGMASLISRFAIGTVAAAAQTNPPMVVQCGQPTQGVRLGLDLPLVFHFILGLIGGLQFFLVLITAILIYRLKVPDEVVISQQEEVRKRFVLS